MLLLLNIIFVVIIGRVAVEAAAAAAAIVHNLARLWLCMKLDGGRKYVQSSAQLRKRRLSAGRVHVKRPN